MIFGEFLPKNHKFTADYCGTQFSTNLEQYFDFCTFSINWAVLLKGISLIQHVVGPNPYWRP